MDSLVSTDWLAEHLSDVDLVVADVRWRPAPPGAGHAAYLESHIPGAAFIDLDTDLAEVPEDPSLGGRHPLARLRARCHDGGRRDRDDLLDRARALAPGVIRRAVAVRGISSPA